MSDEKTPKPKMTGTALEVDVIKKISHQLQREGLSPDAMDRILRFVTSAVLEKKLEIARTIQKNGQLALAAATANNQGSNNGLFGDDL